LQELFTAHALEHEQSAVHAILLRKEEVYAAWRSTIDICLNSPTRQEGRHLCDNAGRRAFLAPTFETEIGLFQHTTALGQQGNFVARIVDRIPDLSIFLRP
jgi:hypothetical protein